MRCAARLASLSGCQTTELTANFSLLADCLLLSGATDGHAAAGFAVNLAVSSGGRHSHTGSGLQAEKEQARDPIGLERGLREGLRHAQYRRVLEDQGQ